MGRAAAGRVFDLQEKVNQVRADTARDVKVELLSRMVGLEAEIVDKGTAADDSLSKVFNRTRRIFNAEVYTVFAGQCALLPSIFSSGSVGAYLAPSLGVAASTAGLLPMAGCMALMFTAIAAASYDLKRVRDTLRQAAAQYEESQEPKLLREIPAEPINSGAKQTVVKTSSASNPRKGFDL
ncbi:MAG: hypothetical protein H3C49_00600 [Alphaproteobacteria bacterium]|nr:hypothetical protein [Alphaproteobacteria bacterium]